MKRTFAYRTRWSVIVWPTSFFLVCALVLSGGAHWLAAAAAWGFVGIGVVLALSRVVRPQHIVLEEDAIVVPRARFSNERQHIPLSSLVNVTLTEAAGQRMLVLEHDEGRFTLKRAMLPSDDDFDVISTELGLDPGLLQARTTPGWQMLALKIAALLSFCGGPLYAMGELTPVIGQDPAFAVGFAPVALMLFGTLSLLEDEPSRTTRIIVGTGAVGGLAIALTSLWAVVRIAGGHAHEDAGLILLGCAVSLVATSAYLWFARR